MKKILWCMVDCLWRGILMVMIGICCVRLAVLPSEPGCIMNRYEWLAVAFGAILLGAYLSSAWVFSEEILQSFCKLLNVKLTHTNDNLLASIDRGHNLTSRAIAIIEKLQTDLAEQKQAAQQALARQAQEESGRLTAIAENLRARNVLSRLVRASEGLLVIRLLDGSDRQISVAQWVQKELEAANEQSN